MRLVEFLTHTTTPQQLVGFLKGKLGIDVAHYVLDENDGVIEMDPSIFDKIKYTVKEFDELLDAYGWRIGAYSDWSLVLRNSRTEYKSDSKFAKQFHGLYLRAAHRDLYDLRFNRFSDPEKYKEITKIVDTYLVGKKTIGTEQGKKNTWYIQLSDIRG